MGLSSKYWHFMQEAESPKSKGLSLEKASVNKSPSFTLAQCTKVLISSLRSLFWMPNIMKMTYDSISVLAGQQPPKLVQSPLNQTHHLTYYHLTTSKKNAKQKELTDAGIEPAIS
ncbi:Protein of unknown function DUF3468 [Penicillium cf. griseofulvum]|nr:Protein of unknown function DUF3468 [Penicillium cf. griseofulvum]